MKLIITPQAVTAYNTLSGRGAVVFYTSFYAIGSSLEDSVLANIAMVYSVVYIFLPGGP